jgi:hypothetical protein
MNLRRSGLAMQPEHAQPAMQPDTQQAATDQDLHPIRCGVNFKPGAAHSSGEFSTSTCRLRPATHLLALSRACRDSTLPPAYQGPCL